MFGYINFGNFNSAYTLMQVFDTEKNSFFFIHRSVLLGVSF